jgi:CheY-like chemotaxis protein
VRVAHTLADARRAAQAQPFDLLISDIGLPDGSGVDLMRQLRDEQPIQGIALSGYGMDHDLQRSLDAGFRTHLTKPVPVAKLHEAIQQAISGLPARRH